MIVLGAAAPKPPLAIPPPSKLGGILATLVKLVAKYCQGRRNGYAIADYQTLHSPPAGFGKTTLLSEWTQ